MHLTAMLNAKNFFETYANAFDSNVKVLEIGSQDVNGSLRQVCPKEFEYIGVDFQKGKGVDIVLDDPYTLPFENESFDIVLSSSCFEHSEMFWLVFLEILRVMKPKSLFYLNAPSTGSFHRYPVDCWRFYPDSGKAMITWAKRNGFNSEMLESYIQKGYQWHEGGQWQDFVGVFIKDATYLPEFPKRIIDTKSDFENGHLYGNSEIVNLSEICQNDKKLFGIQQIISGKLIIS